MIDRIRPAIMASHQLASSSIRRRFTEYTLSLLCLVYTFYLLYSDMRLPTSQVQGALRSRMASHLSSSRSLSTKVPLLLSPDEFKKLPKVSISLISQPQEREQRLQDADIWMQGTTIPVDCSWHMPNSPRSAMAEYLSGPRIPQARRFDLDEVAELDIGLNPLSLTHMMPSQERFAQECRELIRTDLPSRSLYLVVGLVS